MLFTVDPLILAQIGVGWLFIRYLIQKDFGTKEPRRGLIAAGVLGGLATVGAIFLELWLLPHDMATNPGPPFKMLHNALLVGVIEESLKSLPLAIFLYGRRYFNEMSDGIIYFGIGGMVFGIIEGIGYELSFPGSGVARLLTGPYLHAGFCILFGYALARKKMRKNGWWIVAVGWLASVTFHGLYDFGLFYKHGWSVLMSLVITIAINLNIYFLIKRTSSEDSRLGLAAAGVNYYCRHCGRPNPQRFLYCTYCGNKT